MPSGIILSTQTPEETSVFPRRGGTGAGINHVTGFPVLKMHRDAKARDGEREHFQKITNNSIVFITGHSDSELETISGGYVPAAPSEHEAVQPLSTDWTYKQFRDLILENSNLKEGDTLTVVLWACNAGDGGLSSGAGILGRLFREKKINTRIVSSAATTKRFHGHYSTDVDDGSSTVKFETKNGPGDIRIFDFNEHETIEWRTYRPLYATKEGIKGYKLHSPKQLESLETEQIERVLNEIFADRHYFDNVRTEKQILEHLKNKQRDFILRWSSFNNVDKEHQFAFISASFHTATGLRHIRYGINLQGELFVFDAEGKVELNIFPEGVLYTIASHVENIQKNSAIAAHKAQQEQRLNPKEEIKTTRTISNKGDEHGESLFFTAKQVHGLTKKTHSSPRTEQNDRLFSAKKEKAPHVARTKRQLKEEKTERADRVLPTHNAKKEEATPLSAESMFVTSLHAQELLKQERHKEEKSALPKKQQIPIAQRKHKKVAENKDVLFSAPKEKRRTTTKDPHKEHPHTQHTPRTPRGV